MTELRQGIPTGWSPSNQLDWDNIQDIACQNPYEAIRRSIEMLVGTEVDLGESNQCHCVVSTTLVLDLLGRVGVLAEQLGIPFLG